MKILVFGKTGQVATHLSQMPGIIALGRDEADLSKPQECYEAIKKHNVDAVINAAAYTMVDQAEDEEELATRINGDAVEEMAVAACEIGIPFIHISTDYVFSGDGKKAWVSTDPTEPIGAYGRSKLVGEKRVQRAGGKSLILRTSWVFSSHGKNFVKTMLRLAETRSELGVVGDQYGCPTPAEDIAVVCVNLADQMLQGSPGGTYHYSGAPTVSWADFAKTIFEYAELDVQVNEIQTSEYPTKARRPQCSALDCSSLFEDFGIHTSDWKYGLSKVLMELRDD